MPSNYKTKLDELVNLAHSQSHRLEQLSTSLNAASEGLFSVYTILYLSVRAAATLSVADDSLEDLAVDLIEPTTINRMNYLAMSESCLSVVVVLSRHLARLDHSLVDVDQGLLRLNTQLEAPCTPAAREIPSPLIRALKMAEESLSALTQDTAPTSIKEAEDLIAQSRALLEEESEGEEESETEDANPIVKDVTPKVQPTPQSTTPNRQVKPRADSLSPVNGGGKNGVKAKQPSATKFKPGNVAPPPKMSQHATKK